MAKEENKEVKHEEKSQKEVLLIRILGKDISGEKGVYAGLAQIKGISWSFANALCKKLGLDKTKKIQDLSEKERKDIEEFAKNPEIPDFLKNRRKDIDSGKNKHLCGADLDLQKEFDIKNMRKIRCYKGARHAVGLPVRGQRTKSHFRRNRKKSGAVGVNKKGVKR